MTGRLRRGAMVSRHIGDSEVHFMSHGADNRQVAGGDRAGDDFLIESPQIFQRASPATHDEGVQADFSFLVPLIRIVDGLCYFPGRILSLDCHREYRYLDGWTAALKNGEYVVDRGPGWRSNNPEMGNGFRQWSLCFRVE